MVLLLLIRHKCLLSRLVRDIGGDSNHVSVVDYAAEIESIRALVTVAKVLAYGFIVLISMIAAANVFNTMHFEKKGDYRLLKITKDVYWTARKYDNTYVTEPYLIYRNMMFEKLRNNFLEYLISKINEDIDSIKDETKFTGKIIFDSITQNYDKLITEFQSGEKNCEQIGKVIFKGF